MSDWQSEDEDRRAGAIDRVCHAVAVFGGCTILAAGVLIIVSISMRWFYSVSIAGDVELIQTATAITAFAFLPFGQINRSGIIVDTFTQQLPRGVCNRLDAFWDLIYAAIALILAWRLAVGAFDAIHSHTVTTVIRLPVGWFMLAGVVMLCLLALAALVTARRLLRASN
jgi:TRAP-type C4-dicarboxylate transport system permease small subunit